MTGPKPLPKRAVHVVQSRASSFECNIASVTLLRFPSCIPIQHIVVLNVFLWKGSVWDVRAVPTTVRMEVCTFLS